jgi:hypothetical protein
MGPTQVARGGSPENGEIETEHPGWGRRNAKRGTNDATDSGESPRLDKSLKSNRSIANSC